MKRDAVDVIVDQWAERDPDLDVSVLHVIGRLLLAANQAERAVVEALKPHGLSFGDFDVLNTLRRRSDPDGTNPRDLARSALITSGAMTARLDRLHRAGLITREPAAQDRRQVLIRLTERGERLAERSLNAVLAADEKFLAPLSDSQRRALADLLKLLLPPVTDPSVTSE